MLSRTVRIPIFDLMEVQNLIVGGGPAGLAVAGRLRHQNIPITIIEASDKIAVAWHQHYDRLHLHTVKQWSHLPHLPFPDDFPLYVPREKLVSYFEGYAKHFDIKPIFQQEVISIVKELNKWVVTSKDGQSYIAQNVIITTGVNRVTNEPQWPGQDQFQGDIIHSRYYKNADPYIDKKVLVIGLGNTGAELALDLSENGISTVVSVRSEVSVVPRDLNGRPVQVTSKQLAKLPFGIGDWLGSQIRKVYFGNLEKYGLRTSKMHPAQQLRETGKTPIVDIGTMKAIKEGKIIVKPEIRSFKKEGVEFIDGSQMDFDAVILATGYKAKLEDFFPAISSFLDVNGLPRDPIGNEELSGAYFVGFDNYKLGGIIGTINTDSETVAHHIVSHSL